MKKIKKSVKIGLFFGGKISQHLVLVKKAAKKLAVSLDLISYNRVCFDTDSGKIMIRGNIGDETKLGYEGKLKDVNDYDVLFFRTTGKHWEEVDLIISSARTPVVVDPLVQFGKPSYACKAWQMLKLKEAGIDVPKSIYGSLWYLYEVMKLQHSSNHFLGSDECSSTFNVVKKTMVSNESWNFPVIIKGSGGDRGTRVFKADSLEELEILVKDLRKTETEEGKRYMLQEYIANDGDYRVLVLGDKVLGVMKRFANQDSSEFRNNYSAGGSVEVADLPEEVKKLAVRAAKVCGLVIAGVDVAFREFDKRKPVIWEVNKGPQFKGFMKATGIDVPEEIVKYLVSLSNKPL